MRANPSAPSSSIPLVKPRFPESFHSRPNGRKTHRSKDNRVDQASSYRRLPANSQSVLDDFPYSPPALFPLLGNLPPRRSQTLGSLMISLFPHCLLFLFNDYESNVIVDNLGTDVMPQILDNLLLDFLSRALPMLPGHGAKFVEAV
jgi:hypothetical protein